MLPTSGPRRGRQAPRGPLVVAAPRHSLCASSPCAPEVAPEPPERSRRALTAARRQEPQESPKSQRSQDEKPGEIRDGADPQKPEGGDAKVVPGGEHGPCETCEEVVARPPARTISATWNAWRASRLRDERSQPGAPSAANRSPPPAKTSDLDALRWKLAPVSRSISPGRLSTGGSARGRETPRSALATKTPSVLAEAPKRRTRDPHQRGAEQTRDPSDRR